MNPVTIAMERLGWSWNPLLGGYSNPAIGLIVDFGFAKKEYDANRLDKYIKELVADHRREVRRKNNEKI